MIILGIDPGLETIGYGVVELSLREISYVKSGVIKTSKSQPMSKRLQEIYQDMLFLLDDIGADEIAIERLFFNKNITSGMQVSQARGVILAACGFKGYETFGEYTPSQIKLTVCGSGKAKKKDIQLAVKRMFEIEIVDDNEADSIGIAVTHGRLKDVL